MLNAQRLWRWKYICIYLVKFSFSFGCFSGLITEWSNGNQFARQPFPYQVTHNSSFVMSKMDPQWSCLISSLIQAGCNFLHILQLKYEMINFLSEALLKKRLLQIDLANSTCLRDEIHTCYIAAMSRVSVIKNFI